MKYIISVLMLMFMFLFISFTFGDIINDLKIQRVQKKNQIRSRKSAGVQVNHMYYKTR